MITAHARIALEITTLKAMKICLIKDDLSMTILGSLTAVDPVTPGLNFLYMVSRADRQNDLNLNASKPKR